ncbi:alkaline-phosphatase-like protein [Fusarium flagelliforme]|uniref:alkaline-phosphatase-like protein n=1 Tax=Fusarium flagelliforme TaxID=2675880 RepID=UPI001E8D7E4E|nr:alkaline-phosphatase-like protein [Fusarium flagelliforme]KAH7178959.1 alkaline-phosphatase-like protein [Fusarium flagelliforme]
MSEIQPNIIFIMADDHAAKAISAYGAGINHTPNLDRLADGGMLFNHCYVTNSICTPSRATILTGTHNHVNGVMTLDHKINNLIPQAHRHMARAGYQTAMISKWHLGDGPAHCPKDWDYWSVAPGQGAYYDPIFIGPNGKIKEKGYCADIITDKTIDFLEKERYKQAFLRHHLYQEDIKVPETFDDDYKNRAAAAGAAKMRVSDDLTYEDLGLSQPEGGDDDVGELALPFLPFLKQRKVPYPEDVTKMVLIDKETGEHYTFKNRDELRHFKYQRYMKRYCRTLHSVDVNVGRIIDYVEGLGKEISDNTMIIYTSDQGMFLGDHGWFDKRFIYEESFQMPLLIKYPAEIKAGSVCNDIVRNVDFAPLWLDIAGCPIPSYMQGFSFRKLLHGETPEYWQKVAYHRYWMHNDIPHEARAHYGIRNQKYKIIYWYNRDFGLSGANPGGEPPEWELFDCDKDPLEVLNQVENSEYQNVFNEMKKMLEDKMNEIGDIWVH